MPATVTGIGGWFDLKNATALPNISLGTNVTALGPARSLTAVIDGHHHPRKAVTNIGAEPWHCPV